MEQCLEQLEQQLYEKLGTVIMGSMSIVRHMLLFVSFTVKEAEAQGDIAPERSHNNWG